MNAKENDFFFTLNTKRVFLYYLGYCSLFWAFHLASVSLVSFFHFLLDHNMAVIENWLYRNAWEMIIISKVIAAFIIIKALKLNNYFSKSLFKILKEDEWKPNRSLIVILFFLSILFYALILQFGGGITNNSKQTGFAYISFFGSILFYLVDLFTVSILVRNVDFQNKKKNVILGILILSLFIIFTKATLPYINKFFILILLHFLTLLVLLFRQSKNMANPLLYALVVIGPFSSFYGLDIVWENAHSVYSYKNSLPVAGIIGIWLIALGYYCRKS